METVSEALILMAGSGSRLRVGSTSTIKPLTPVLGRPLISYVFEALVRGGIKKVCAVVGFQRKSLIEQLNSLTPRELEVVFVENPDWQKQNGISVLAAAKCVAPPFFLTMSDHLFDQAIIDLLFRHAGTDQLNVAIDRKCDSIFDLDDAMKVQTSGDRVVAIGKQLTRYDSIDTGLFVCPGDFFDYLESAKHGGDCSLADGVRAMARDEKVRAIDIGDAWWQDVDTPQMLAAAENHLRSRPGRDSSASIGTNTEAREPAKD